MRGLSRAQAPEIDEDDPESIRRNKRWHSSHSYNRKNRHLRNTKKKERMSTLRAQQALDAPEIVEARRLAAREASRKYRDGHRDVLALKAKARRAADKSAQERANTALERRRRRELLPLAVPSSYTAAQRAAAAAEHARRQSEYASDDSDDSDGG
ncbi:hypothetical protein DFH06DRAFT_1341648 [Mycena polygramma]|nr:hypothetical protein DFH06DRAFT_1341648 [Mycena polygramma]